jgi:hypothetical protein
LISPRPHRSGLPWHWYLPDIRAVLINGHSNVSYYDSSSIERASCSKHTLPCNMRHRSSWSTSWHVQAVPALLGYRSRPPPDAWRDSGAGYEQFKLNILDPRGKALAQPQTAAVNEDRHWAVGPGNWSRTMRTFERLSTTGNRRGRRDRRDRIVSSIFRDLFSQSDSY